MVFLNYSTMQMVAKIVYYGPGLGGKTSNLQYIYDHTSKGSRGEMVSLETDTDRTLFFDLLPIEIGSIGGFETRIQLYTVPGQVFYNATRKLVLKGVDGVVFVADSQRPTLDANLESLSNLADNLAGVGVKLDEVPLVMQFNKQDLPDVCPVEEMDSHLNRHGWQTVAASALTGEGIFETLATVSKLTLRSLRQRLGGEEEEPRRLGRLSATSELKRPVPPAADHPTPATANPRVAAPPPAAEPPAQPPTVPAPPAALDAPKPPAALPESESEDLQALAQRILRDEATGAETGQENGDRPGAATPMTRDLEVEIPRRSLEQTRKLSMTLQFRDSDSNVVGNLERHFEIEDDSVDPEELLLRLNVTVHAQD